MRRILSLYGAENGTCPTAVGARVGSDCHRQPFTSDPSSPVSNIKREYAMHTLSLWCGKRDLNPYGVNHTPLKRARLPVPPLPHSLERYIVYYTSFRLSRVNFKKTLQIRKKDRADLQSCFYTDSMAQSTVSSAAMLSMRFALLDFFLRIMVASIPI